MTRVLLAIACGLALSSPAVQADALVLPGTDRAGASQSGAPWAVRGGEATFLLHGGLAQELGLSIRGEARPDEDFHKVVALDIDDTSSLEFDADAGLLQQLLGGSLKFRGELKLKSRTGEIDLTGFTLRPLAGTPRDLQLVDSGGKTWLLVDHVHYESLDEQRTLSMRNLDLRVTPALADWLGDPALAGLAIGSMAIRTEVVRSPAPAPVPQNCTDFDWPGELHSNGTGQVAVADVLLEAMSSLDYKGCQGCDGPGGASNGSMKFAPNATLRNSNNPLTADIAWYSKFTSPSPPYNNDQHPYFVWNVYRINASGQIDQIGRSGTKHAFLTVNSACAPGENCNSHVLGSNCGDTYSSGNNESTSSLGPRSEIIPYTSQWARCGSGYDADCNGAIDSPIPYGAFDNRMLMRESDVEAVSNPGAQYFFEGWYVVRDDVNIYNTMGYRQFTPSFSTTWSATNPGAFTLGPAINRWVNHASPGSNARSVDIGVRDNGALRVAMKVTDLGNGNHRFDYAVMNFDYALVETSGSEPNLRMLSSRGMTAFEVLVNAGVVTSSESFRDVDLEAGNNWTMSKPGTMVRWAAPAGGNDLTWGTLFRFSLEGSAPAEGTVQIVGSDGTTYPVTVLVPSGGIVAPDTLFRNSFE